MWTRLEGTELWEAARDAHANPIGRRYHVFAHPMRLYAIAEALGIPYDEDLDKAILFHDAVYRGLPDDVQKSAELLLSLDPTATKAAQLIMTTLTHAPSADNRLVLLDLHDLGDPPLWRQNRVLMAEEFENLKGISREEFTTGSAVFMMDLKRRIIDGVGNSDVHRDDLERFMRIVQGINEVFVPEHETPAP